MKYTEDDVKKIIDITKKYEATENGYSLILFVTNLVIFFFCIHLLNVFKNTYYIFPMVLLTSLIILRNFMVFHDLGHASFFPSDERENNTIGINKTLCDLLDFFYYYPGKDWIKTHSAHHKVHGNIDEYDEARTLISSDDYEKQPYFMRKMYDVIRHPLVFYIITPLYTFNIARLVNFNFIFLLKIGIFLYIVKYFSNMETVILLLISYYIASIMGVMLFHLQHAMNEPSWFKHKNENDKDNSELNGSSVLKIPEFLKPFTNGIEYHNVHHINPGVPSYNIRKCYEELREKEMLKNHEYSMKEMFDALSHTLYDSKKDKYIYHYNVYN